jgi:thiamine pyrophosphate-dependent acetolactate synthase large subunit-like protein
MPSAPRAIGSKSQAPATLFTSPGQRDVERPSIDYVHLAQAMGVPTARVERAADIAPTIEAGIAIGKANLVEVIISAS